MEQLQFFKSQYPVFIISKIVGLAPFSVNFDVRSFNPDTWVQLSLPWLIYSMALYAGYLYSFAFCFNASWRIPLERDFPFISVVGGKT